MKELIPIQPGHIGRLWYSDSPNLDYFHRHDELECNIVVRGRGSYIVENQRIDMVANSVAWLFPEQEHLMLNTSEDFALWIMVIRPEYLQQSCVDDAARLLLARKPAGLHLRHINPDATQQLQTICKQVIAAQSAPSLHNATLGYLLHRCLASYQQGSVVPLQQRLHPAIQQIIHQLLAHKETADLPGLARQVGLTPETVSRLFKRQTGLTLSTYRNRCRLDRFLNNYGDGHGPTMLDAALEAGFGSYAQFYRVFGEMMGQTPAQYRRGLRQPPSG